MAACGADENTECCVRKSGKQLTDQLAEVGFLGLQLHQVWNQAVVGV